MSGFISGLQEVVTSASIWAEIVPAAGFIGALILVKVGYNVVKSAVNNASRPNSKKAMR